MHKTFDAAYVMGLRDLLEKGVEVDSVTDPNSPASNFGLGDRPAIELLAYTFQVGEPLPSLLETSARKFNLPYAIGLLLWTIGGSDSVEWLSYYNPRAAHFSQDPLRICAAFGKRLLDHEGIDQVGKMLDRLTTDKASRRAAATVLIPEDNRDDARDYPCAMGIQCFVRENRLAFTTIMRAQQAMTVLPFDSLIFMTLQSIMAARLGVKLGPYTHFAGTFHIYTAETSAARQLIDQGVRAVPLGEIPEWNGDIRDSLLTYERGLRDAAIRGNVREIGRLTNGISVTNSSFVNSVCKLLGMYAWTRVQKQPPEEMDLNFEIDGLRRLALDYWREPAHA